MASFTRGESGEVIMAGKAFDCAKRPKAAAATVKVFIVDFFERVRR